MEKQQSSLHDNFGQLLQVSCDGDITWYFNIMY